MLCKFANSIILKDRKLEQRSENWTDKMHLENTGRQQKILPQSSICDSRNMYLIQNLSSNRVTNTCVLHVSTHQEHFQHSGQQFVP